MTEDKEKNPQVKKPSDEDYEPPKIVEKKKLEVELFSDEPDPWGGCGP